MADDWRETLLGATLEIVLPTLSFIRGGSAGFRGSGHITWGMDSGIRVIAHTDGANVLKKDILRAGAALGHLLPHGKYISASGRTEDGWDVSTHPEWPVGYSIGISSPLVLWDFKTDGLALTRETIPREHPRLVRALLGPSPKEWPRMTHTEIHNDGETSSASHRDCLLVDFSFGSLYARQRTDRWYEVQVEITGTSPRSEALEIIVAVAHAFGFVLGRRQFLLGFEDFVPGRETRRLFVADREPTNGSIATPLGTSSAYLAEVENLLGRAIDFFLTKQGERVAKHLWLCWDAADNAFPTRLAVASICLEGLISLVQHQSETNKGNEVGGDSSDSMEADLKALKELLKTAEDAKTLTPEFIKRLRGAVAAFRRGRPSDVLWDWQRKGLLGVTTEDIDAWKKTRHPAAHGALVAPPEDKQQLQDLISRFYREVNLINRVVLQLMGYRGLYVDYGSPGWQEKEFPAALPVSL